MEFEVCNMVVLKISPMKGVMRFKIKGKLNPHFIGPFEILKRIGDLVYELALPQALLGVHNIFHVSKLRKYMLDPSYILNFEPLELCNDLSYEEIPILVLDHKVKELRRKKTALVKVLWRNHEVEEATWE